MVFFKKWLPELAEIPVNLIHEPWKLNMIEQQFYDCEIGKDYPALVNIEETRRYASDIVWSFRKRQSERGGKKNIEKHVSNPNRKTRKTKF
jgi:deoxyribodipyrimidine photo-lyase